MFVARYRDEIGLVRFKDLRADFAIHMFAFVFILCGVVTYNYSRKGMVQKISTADLKEKTTDDLMSFSIYNHLSISSNITKSLDNLEWLFYIFYWIKSADESTVQNFVSWTSVSPTFSNLSSNLSSPR